MPELSKEEIIKFSEELGFFKIGFASPSVPAENLTVYQNWLELGYHATMEYLRNGLEKRQYLSKVLPGVKTVIMTAFNYYTGEDFKHGELKISRYAQIRDYHKFMIQKLKALARKIKEYAPEAQFRIYSDTGPIMEKALAAKAGIGWQGKNGIIISKERGSWLFLGTILTTLEFEPDSPAVDSCGTCNICMDSCPTSAIVQPGVVNANKCISYWTTEAPKTGDIPEDIKENKKGWLYGCDICQEVCPWNIKFGKVNPEAVNLRRIKSSYSHKEIMAMDDEKFVEIFTGTPVKRRGIEVLKKNSLK
ncbi:MAG: hypothetical protein HW421_3579 [Ignavibacteria bacterium]|nr:hypothetical protein [Ignavibacteria bacterium]